MSIATRIGKAALVGSLLIVAHSDAHALARKAMYRPAESLRAAHPAYVVDSRSQSGKQKAGTQHINALFYYIPRCLFRPTSCTSW